MWKRLKTWRQDNKELLECIFGVLGGLVALYFAITKLVEQLR